MREDDYISREDARAFAIVVTTSFGRIDAVPLDDLDEIPPANVVSKDLIDKRIEAALEVLLEVEGRGRMPYDDYLDLRDAINKIGEPEGTQ